MKWKLKHLLILILLATSQTIVAMEEKKSNDDNKPRELQVGDIVPGINIEKLQCEELGLPYHNGRGWEEIWDPILEQEDKIKRRKKYAFKINESNYMEFIAGINTILYKNEQCNMLLQYKKLVELDKSLDMILKAKNVSESKKIIFMKKMVAAGANINYDNAFAAVCNQGQWHLARLMLCLGANVVEQSLEEKFADLDLAEDEEEALESDVTDKFKSFFKLVNHIKKNTQNPNAIYNFCITCINEFNIIPNMLINGNSLLHMAIRIADEKLVVRLLQKCLSPLINSFPDRFPALHAAIVMRDHKNSDARNAALLNIIKHILTNGVNVCRETKDGLNALHLAVFKNDDDAVKMLLKYPTTAVNLRTSDRKKQTALHMALELPDRVSEVIIDLLLAANPNINIQDSNGSTPLHLAMLVRNPYILLSILSKSPNPNIKNAEGYTAIDLTEVCNPEIRKIMRAYKQDCLISSQDKGSYFYQAIQKK